MDLLSPWYALWTWCLLSYLFTAWYWLHDPRLLPMFAASIRRCPERFQPWAWGAFWCGIILAPLFWALYLLLVLLCLPVLVKKRLGRRS